MKLVIRICLVVLLIGSQSCKPKKVIGEGTVDEKLEVTKIIKNHYANALDFKTIGGKVKISYDDGLASQSFTVNLRMEKDKAIWMSESILGVVKAYITPNGVSFYNKLDNTYFEGDFAYLSKLLGTEVDFDKLQRILVGEAILDLNKGKYTNTVVDNRYQLKPTAMTGMVKYLFQIEPKYYKIALQQLAQPAEGRTSAISYSSYQEVDGQSFPNKLQIKVDEPDGITTIDVEYKNIKFNEQLSFPYNIPSGYTPITLD